MSVCSLSNEKGPVLFQPGRVDDEGSSARSYAHEPLYLFDVFYPLLLTILSNWRTRRSVMASHRKRLCPRQQRLSPHQRGANLARPKRRAGRADPDDARFGKHMEQQIQLPVDLLQRQAVHRRIQEAHPSRDKSQVFIWYAAENLQYKTTRPPF